LQSGEIPQGVVAVCGHGGEVGARWTAARKHLSTCGGCDENDGGNGVEVVTHKVN
jgi:hypothetical protein